MSSKVHKIQLDQLLPSSEHYITYEGSLTEPACYETVQWIIINKPIYVSSNDLNVLRNMVQLEGSHGDNFRPLQPNNFRSLRTNIVFHNHDNKKHISSSPSSSTYGVHNKYNNVSMSKSTISSSNPEVNNHELSVNRIKFCSGRGYVTYKGEHFVFLCDNNRKTLCLTANVGKIGMNEFGINSMALTDAELAAATNEQDWNK